MADPPPPTREEIARVFGPNALSWGLFYVHDPALRFELSAGGTYVEMFTRAYDRGRELLSHAFAGSASLAVVLESTREAPGSRGLPGRLSVFRSMRECGIPIPRAFSAWCEPAGTGWEDLQRGFLAFRCAPGLAPRLLWGAIAGEIGVRPRLRCRVYLAELERGILAHPYDDRGMDLVGPNTALLRELYTRFGGWLLDFDRARMDAMFAA